MKPVFKPIGRRLALFVVLLLCASTAARAHDTWFEKLPTPRGQASAHGQLLLGTGNRYPVQESGVDMVYLTQQGCKTNTAASPAEPLSKVRNMDTALVLRAPTNAHTCWAQLQGFDVAMPGDKVALYFREIQAPGAVKEAWAAQQAQGLSWTERYTKHARVALSAAGFEAPSPMAVDMVIEGADPSASGLRMGQPLRLRVLRGGQPVAGLAVELQTRNSRWGVWRRTDAEGRALWPALPAGSWLARATELRLAAADASHGQRWESDFMTLAFEVVP
jgi:hypothetical protein